MSDYTSGWLNNYVSGWVGENNTSELSGLENVWISGKLTPIVPVGDLAEWIDGALLSVLANVGSQKNFTKQDRINITDSRNISFNLVRTILNNINMSDTLGKLVRYLINKLDNISWVDTQYRAVSIIRTIEDGLNIRYLFSRTTFYLRLKQESSSILSSAYGKWPSMIFLESNIVISDSVQNIFLIIRTIFDEIRYSDFITRSRAALIFVLDSFGISHFINRAGVYTRKKIENISAIDNVVISKTFFRIITNSLNFVERVITRRGLNNIKDWLGKPKINKIDGTDKKIF